MRRSELRVLANPAGERGAWPAPSRAPLSLHRRLPGYAPTPLVELPRLAARVGAARVIVKDEGARLDLAAFKVLGASWAALRALDLDPEASLEEVGAGLGGVPELVTASEGNHGRAVARVARWLGLPARIVLPADVAPTRAALITAEGARVERVDGTYEQAVARARELGGLLLQDTAWPGYEEIPRWIVDGYATLCHEIDDAAPWAPDLVLAPIGVGSFASSVVRHYRAADREHRPRVWGVEPAGAACGMAAVESGGIAVLPDEPHTVMRGLCCGAISSEAWPFLSEGIEGFLAVDDRRVPVAQAALCAEGVDAGPTGVAGAAALIALADDARARAELGWEDGQRVLLFATEGARASG